MPSLSLVFLNWRFDGSEVRILKLQFLHFYKCVICLIYRIGEGRSLEEVILGFCVLYGMDINCILVAGPVRSGPEPRHTGCPVQSAAAGPWVAGCGLSTASSQAWGSERARAAGAAPTGSPTLTRAEPPGSPCGGMHTEAAPLGSLPRSLRLRWAAQRSILAKHRPSPGSSA